MQPRTYTFDQIFALLNLTPEAFLRDYGRFHIMDPYSDDPQFVLVRKDEGEIAVDLSHDGVDILGIGYNREHGVFRLSAMGDLPITLVSKLLSAINWRLLTVDKDGHSLYGFFPTERRETSHFLMECECDDAIRVETIDGHPVDKFEFAITRNGNLELVCLAGGNCYQSTVKLSTVKKGTIIWRPIIIPGNSEVFDFSTRIFDDNVHTMLATGSGAYLWRNGDLALYPETKDKNVIAIVAGIPNYRTRDKRATDRDTARMAFVIRKDDGIIELFTSSIVPTSSILPVAIADDSVRTSRDDVRILAGNDGCWYLGTFDKVTAIGIPTIS